MGPKGTIGDCGGNLVEPCTSFIIIPHAEQKQMVQQNLWGLIQLFVGDYFKHEKKNGRAIYVHRMPFIAANFVYFLCPSQQLLWWF